MLVWDVSRLGRSLQHLVEFLNDVQSVGCNLYIHQSGLDTSTPSGRMMFQMVGVFSEFERSMISERVKLGLHRVKTKGKHLGPPVKVDKDFVSKVQDLWSDGLTLDQIRQHVELSRSTIYRVIRGQSRYQVSREVLNV